MFPHPTKVRTSHYCIYACDVYSSQGKEVYEKYLKKTGRESSKVLNWQRVSLAEDLRDEGFKGGNLEDALDYWESLPRGITITTQLILSDHSSVIHSHIAHLITLITHPTTGIQIHSHPYSAHLSRIIPISFVTVTCTYSISVTGTLHSLILAKLQPFPELSAVVEPPVLVEREQQINEVVSIVKTNLDNSLRDPSNPVAKTDYSIPVFAGGAGIGKVK